MTAPVTDIQTTDQPKRDYRQEVTNQIVAMLENGVAPWQKPWEPGALQLPFNPTSEKAYRGGNALHLMAVGAQKSYEDPRWLTYKQAQENGWQVRQGEKGTQIEYWQFDDRQAGKGNEDEVSSRDDAHRGLLRRVYTVFNARQVDGIPAYKPKMPQEWEIVRTGEQILRNSGARVAHDQQDRAFYNRTSDAIHLPAKQAFRVASDYYSTALHELAHWSGHPSRLNRPTLNESYSFGDANYAKEELRAELASIFLAAERGIPHNPEQHAAYVGAWIKALRDDKNEIFRAARDAHKAADFILDLERGKSLDGAHNVQVRRETSEHVADYERGSGTVNLIEKETGTENRNPVVNQRPGSPDAKSSAKAELEKILDGEVQGKRPPSEAAIQKSLADAENLTRRLLGESSRLYPADLDSGRYRGEVVGETDLHVIQKLNARTAIAHLWKSLAEPTEIGQKLSITYANGGSTIKPFKAREKVNVLAR